MDDGRPEEERPSIVFWIIVVLVVLYLAVRLVQGIGWVVERMG